MKTIDVKGKPYVEVNERLKYFREHYQDWGLESEMVSLENGVCVIKAIIRNPEGIIKATGYAYEKEGSTFINKTSFIENCETSAWGRALGNLGIGIDTSIASAEEVQNAVLNQKEAKKDRDVSDFEIYRLLYKIDDIDAVKSYYDLNKEEVINRVMFYEECQKQIRNLKRIAKIPAEETVQNG